MRAELPGNGDYSTEDATLFRICVRKTQNFFLSSPLLWFFVVPSSWSTPRISFLFGELLTVVVAHAQRVKDAGLRVSRISNSGSSLGIKWPNAQSHGTGTNSSIARHTKSFSPIPAVRLTWLYIHILHLHRDRGECFDVAECAADDAYAEGGGDRRRRRRPGGSAVSAVHGS